LLSLEIPFYYKLVINNTFSVFIFIELESAYKDLIKPYQ
jgi:hypothetical protein